MASRFMDMVTIGNIFITNLGLTVYDCLQCRGH